jgi:hypothetical protein
MRRKTPLSLNASLFWLALILLLAPSAALAADDGERTFAPGQGVPVNTQIGGGGIVPTGHFLAVYNTSYRGKYEGVEGKDVTTNRNIDNTTFQQRLKLRYGLSDHIELNAMIPYNFYDPMSGRNQDSWGDIMFGPNFGLLQERYGDPLSVALLLRVGLPTGSVGTHYAAGGGVWSGQAILSLTKTFGLHQLTAEFVDTLPLEEGNLHTRRGNSAGMTYKYAYALNRNWDIGIEGTIDKGWNGSRNGVEVKNNSLEWYTGPAVNFAVPGTSLTLGVGAYLPVYRDYGMNTSTDAMRFDCKIAYMW